MFLVLRLRSALVTAGIGLMLTATPPQARTSADTRCLLASGNAAVNCVKRYTAAIDRCRARADAACEAGLHAAGGTLDQLLAATEAPTRRGCPPASADKLTFLAGIDDLVARTAQACRKWADDFAAQSYATNLVALSPATRTCQRTVVKQLRALRTNVVRAYGRGCYVPESNGGTCRRAHRDVLVAGAKARASAAIAKRCGPTFDQLGLASGTNVADVVVARARHLAQRVYPPLNLGPTGLFGAAPVGVRTLALLDASRTNVAGTGPRPVNVEIYYPSTAAAVAGATRDAPQSLFVTPTYRDVARAPGTFPLVLFSPGGGSDSWEYVYLFAHLASHGFLVASVNHHGDHLLDTSDPDTLVNRPLDLHVLLDQLLALNARSDGFLAGAIDPDRVGAAGHSTGGYVVEALAACPFPLGAFVDPRIKAILPIDGAAQYFTGQAPTVLSTITIPALLLSGSMSQLAPIEHAAFDALAPGPSITAYANLRDANHGTFKDTCEIPDAILQAFNGGPAAECEPESVPWRYARHLDDYLALNFFAATLNDDAEARARLGSAALTAAIEDVTYQNKAGSCPAGSTCSATCAAVVCGDGIVGPREACDPPGAQGACAPATLCNESCTACVDCGGATVIGPEGGTQVGTTVGGTMTFDSRCGFETFAPERVFQWTPRVSHVATIQTCGGTTNYDTTLYVREGSCVGSDVACNDDACGSQSRITLPVVGGTTYFIMVDGFGTAAGDFTLSVSPSGAFLDEDPYRTAAEVAYVPLISTRTPPSGLGSTPAKSVT